MAESFLQSLMGGYQLGSQIKQDRNQSKLAQLASQAYSAPQDQRQGFLAQAVGVDPNAGIELGKSLQGVDDQRTKTLVQAARYLTAAPEASRPAIYQQMKPSLAHFGMQLPDQYDDTVAQTAQALVQAYGGVGGNVQSTYVDAQGNRVAIMRDGSQQVLGPNAPNNQIIDTGNGFFGVNKGNLQAAPVMVGGQQQQRAPGEVPFSIDPSLPPEVQAQIRANPDAGSAQGITSLPAAYGGPQGGGEQLRSVPKPQEQGDVFVPLSQDEVSQMGLPPGTIAQRNLKTGKVEFAPGTVQPQASGPTPAQAFKMQQTAKKERQLLQSTTAGFEKTINLIDDILKDKGDLGGVTGLGRVGAMIPGTDWADLNAKLTTLKAQSAFGRLQEMRASSPTGGALGSVSERELDLLQNAETQLSNSQSPEALAKALENYKQTLMAAKRRLGEGYQEFYSDTQVAGESPQTNSVLRYNPATGDFE